MENEDIASVLQNHATAIREIIKAFHKLDNRVLLIQAIVFLSTGMGIGFLISEIIKFIF